MIPDFQTNVVFISDRLHTKHPEVESGLRTLLGDRLRILPGTKDIWCRDFMPIQLAPNRFLQFIYDPKYLEYDTDLRTDNGSDLLGLDCTRSSLVIDGGNIVRWHDAAIMTDKVYKENPGVERPVLQKKFQKALEVERLVVIPKEPYDTIGHSDGMVRFVDAKTVLVNDYKKASRAFVEELHKTLNRHGLEIIPFPYCPTNKVVNGIPSAVGVYINFLQIEGLIVCPTFGIPKDDDALKMLAEVFAQQRIVPLRCKTLAVGGGVLNCATWNVVA